MTELQKMGAAAKEAAAVLRTAGEKKRRALLEAAQALRAETARILEANALDLAAARESGMRDAMLDRLTALKSDWLNLLKLRASYGISGRADYGTDLYLDVYGTGGSYYFGKNPASISGIPI